MKNIKKLTSVILAVVLIFAMSSVAFAAPGSGTPIENSHWFGYNRMVSLIEEEEPLWDYDPETRLYVDENGIEFRVCKGHSADEPVYIEKTSDNGIKVEYDSSYFENNDEIVLKAKETKEASSGNFAEYDDDGVVIKRYEIYLADNNGVHVKSNENSTAYTVRIPVPAEYESYKQFLIKHWITLENGTKKGEILYGRVEDGYIVFKTKSFSCFEVLVDFGFNQDSVEMVYSTSVSVPATTCDSLNVTYISSNSDIVAVDANGSITAKGRGTATVTATFENDYGETFTDTCEVAVKFTFWQWIIYILFLGFLWY